MTGVAQPSPAPGASGTPAGVRPAVYGRNYSYFSHRIFVAFTPEDLHKYLHDRLTQVDAAGKPIESSTDPVEQAEAIELQIVRWVLLHRSQLNALALNRELESWRGTDGLLMLPANNGVRSDNAYRLDITLQIAVELALADALGNAMLKNRPRLLLALIDAAYFISRRRAEHDRLLGEARTEASIDIDLSESGAKDFEAYLVQRMNLDEDKPASQAGLGRASVAAIAGRGPLSAKEVTWLQGVAIEVARTLSSAATAAELQLRWETAFRARWEARKVPMPGSTPFEAMLTRDGDRNDCPLVAVAAEAADGSQDATPEDIESFKYKWRVPPFAAAPWAQSLIGIAKQNEPLCRFIDKVEGLLRGAMFGLDPANQPSPDVETQALRLLADGYRVLPITPAWTAVSEAIVRMRDAGRGVGNTAALNRDSRLLHQYANMLRAREAADAVRFTLIAGAALAGMRPGVRRASLAPLSPEQPSLADWTTALTAVHDGLGLDAIDVATAARRLNELCSGLLGPSSSFRKTYVPKAVPKSPTDNIPWTDDQLLTAWPSPRELKGAIAAAYKAGITLAESPPSDRFVAAAWKRLEERLRSRSSNRLGAAPAGSGELVCTMRGIGPWASLPLRLGEAGARVWTGVLFDALHGLGGAPDAAAQKEWLVGPAAHALERLGMRSLDSSTAAAVLKGLSLSDEARRQISAYAKDHNLWTGNGRSQKVALVLGPARGSLVDGWTLPPIGGLVLAAADISPEQLQAKGVGGINQSDHVQMRIAFEPSSGRESAMQQLEDWALSLANQGRLIRLWLYRTGSVGSLEPQLIDPKSSDGLWNWERPLDSKN